MKKILNENQQKSILSAASKVAYEGNSKLRDELHSVLTSVDEAEKRLAELQPPDLRTEELTFKVTYDANVFTPEKVTEELKCALKCLTFISVDLILPRPEDIVMSPGEGFRWLDGKEMLQSGDQCRNSFGEWMTTFYVGCLATHQFIYRRRIRS